VHSIWGCVKIEADKPVLEVEMVGQAINYSIDDEHILRRLGGAIIVLWDRVPDALKEELVQQAADMVDRTVIVQADFEIKKFIDIHRGGDL
jgi:hypothetical protein